jgi:hypothetical protein
MKHKMDGNKHKKVAKLEERRTTAPIERRETPFEK